VQSKKRDIILDKKSISNNVLFIKKYYEVYKKNGEGHFALLRVKNSLKNT